MLVHQRVLHKVWRSCDIASTFSQDNQGKSSSLQLHHEQAAGLGDFPNRWVLVPQIFGKQNPDIYWYLL